MYGGDIDLEVWRDVPGCTDVCDEVTGRHGGESLVVDGRPIRRRRRQFTPVDRGETPRDDRPRVRVSRRFAGKVPGIELGEGGLEVVGVEHDSRHDPFVGVDFDDGENIDAEGIGRLIPAPVASSA